VSEHPLSRWESWESVGEVVRGQMGRREKFMEDVEGVRYRRGRVRERETDTYYTVSDVVACYLTD